MPWDVQFHPDFLAEFNGFSEAVQDALVAHVLPLRQFGPTLGRPSVDTLKGSTISNLKELRVDAGGVWRVAFAFDGNRIGVLLAGADKRGVKQQRFYKTLISTAEERWSTWT